MTFMLYLYVLKTIRMMGKRGFWVRPFAFTERKLTRMSKEKEMRENWLAPDAVRVSTSRKSIVLTQAPGFKTRITFFQATFSHTLSAGDFFVSGICVYQNGYRCVWFPLLFDETLPSWHPGVCMCAHVRARACTKMAVPDSVCYFTRHSHDFLAGVQVASLA